MTTALTDALEAALLVTAGLEALGIDYCVGGSAASSLLGEPRATLDVDIVTALTASSIDAFARAIESSFFVDADMARDAIAHRSAFNVLHLATMFKIDVSSPGSTS